MTASTYVHKIEKIGDIAKDHGWEIKYKTEIPDDPNKIKWKLIAKRAPEILSVEYEGNRMVDATYLLGDKASSPPHKAAVVKLLMGQPDLTRADPTSIARNRRIPFDPTNTPAREILDMLLAKRITWLSSLTTELESERIDIARNKGSRYYRILRKEDGRRYLEFISQNAFRAVYLDAIVSVT